MAGLTAARLLKENAVVPTILEKSRGLGGRMATRRIEDAVLDHGAQFLTARDPKFQHMVAEWESKGVIREWCRGFPADTGPRLCDGHPRYKAVGGMTRLARHLGGDIDIRFNVQIATIRTENGHWRVTTEAGESHESDALILTPPVPQSLELLGMTDCKIPSEMQNTLKGIEYDSCVAVMALLTHPSNVPEPGAIRFAEGPVAFLSDNHRKGISPKAWAITVQSCAEFAREHWNETDDVIAAKLLEAVAQWIEPGSAKAVQVKRWQYSMPLELYPEPCLMATPNPPLLLAGDAFGGPRIEGAALSGLAAAGMLLGVPTRLDP